MGCRASPRARRNRCSRSIERRDDRLHRQTAGGHGDHAVAPGYARIHPCPADPGGSCQTACRATAPAETINRIRHAYGFDKPFFERYGLMLERFAHGNFGYSFSRSEPVRSVIARGAKRTLLLASLAFLVE